jgi:hypothetical protein
VDLSSAPKQVDLMALNPSDTPGFCGTLFQLGTEALPPGKYQQIRLYLLSNTPASGAATPGSNLCQNSTGWNCVESQSGAFSELQLPSEVQTGIKIPSSQITSGGLTVSAGESVDFNIDIDGCSSIVPEGNGQYRLMPVLHAAELSLNGSSTISGKVVEGAGSPNPGMGVPNATVLLELPNVNVSTTPATDQVVLGGVTNSDGTFAFCPVPAVPTGDAGYDVVVAGTTTQTVTALTTTTYYNPSVVFGVPVGGGTGSIPLFPETTKAGTATGATIAGQIQTSDGSAAAFAGDVLLSPLMSVTNGSTTVSVTVPVLMDASTPAGSVSDSQPPVYTTLATPTSSCASASEDCVAYSITVPASAAAVGAYSSSSGNTVASPSSTDSATYTINGLANGSDSLSTCTSPTGGSASSDAVNVTPGSSVDQTTDKTLILTLSGCS